MIAYLKDNTRVEILGEYDNSTRTVDTDETVYISQEKVQVKTGHLEDRPASFRVLRTESELTFALEEAS